MNFKEKKIRDAIMAHAKNNGPDYLLDGTVTAVDSEAYTCDVDLDIGGTQPACRLRATASGTASIDVLPTVGSSVVIAKITAIDYLVLACDEITSYRITVGNMVFTINENGFGISNGADSLKQILADLVTGLLSVYAPKDVTGITALQERITALLQ